MPARRRILIGSGALLAMGAGSLGLGRIASAHHGWRWTADGNFELTGIIRKAQLGNPHGILIVDADGEQWTVEVGQPWRNERAGLDDQMLVEGVEIIASGHRSSDQGEKLMKAERLTIDGTVHDLYPDRD